MTDVNPGRMELGLDKRDGEWSLYAAISGEAVDRLSYFNTGLVPADASLFGDAEPAYRVPLLDPRTMVDALDVRQTKHLVDCVDLLEQYLYDYDEASGEFMSSGPIRRLDVGSARAGDGRLWMAAEIARPKLADDTQVSEIATSAMRSVARKMRYMYSAENSRHYEKTLSREVWADYVRKKWLTVTTSPIGSCSLDTDGFTYKPDSETIELHQHNLYSHAQQLICLVGVVAVAYADTLVKQ